MPDHKPTLTQSETQFPFEPIQEYVIRTLETLKVFSDPLRQQIIETLIETSKTVKQVATELQLAPTKLYYHVNLLEQHHLITVAQTRVVSGIIEKQYRASAYNFSIHRALLSPVTAPNNPNNNGTMTVLHAMLDPVFTDVSRAIEHGLVDFGDDAEITRKVQIWRALSRMSKADAAEFYRRLEEIAIEFDAKKQHQNPDEEEGSFGLIVGIYPTQTAPKKDTSRTSKSSKKRSARKPSS